MGWQTSTSLCTDLALDILKMAIWQCQCEGNDLTGLVHYFDRGVQCQAIRYTQPLAEADAVAPVGPEDDTGATTRWLGPSSPYKAELIRNRAHLDDNGPWQSLGDVETATAEWVHYYNAVRPTAP